MNIINKIKIDFYERVAFRSYTLSKFDKADRYFRKILEIEPDKTGIAYNLGAVNFAMGNLAEAEKFVSRERQLTGNTYEICKALGDIGWQKKDSAMSLTYYKAALEHAGSEHDKNLMNKKIELCSDENKFTEAVDSVSLFKEADQRMMNKEYDKAEELYEQGIEKDPSNFLALINIGVIAMNIRMNYDMAEKYFQQAYEISDIGVIKENMKKLAKMRDKTGR
jgi:tetratricopeptide (TPR) repeat protein